MPISTRTDFPPKTKIHLARYTQDPSVLDSNNNPIDQEGNIIQPQVTYDFVVDKDEVELYAGVPTICTHRIHLIEPSVIAQGMHVDNIALTYELQDVTLNYRTVTEVTDKILDGVIATPGGYQEGT